MLRQKLEDYLRLQNEVAELKKKQSELEKLVDTLKSGKRITSLLRSWPEAPTVSTMSL